MKRASTLPQNLRLEDMARAVEQSDGYRVLRSIPKPFEQVPKTIPRYGRIVAVVDCETTGTDPEHDLIVELAIQLLVLGSDDRIVGMMGPRSWREDPGRPLDPEITKLTGLTDADVRGATLDEHQIMSMLNRASLGFVDKA